MHWSAQQLSRLRTPASHQRSASLDQPEGPHARGQLEARWLQARSAIRGKQRHERVAIPLPLNVERIDHTDFFSDFFSHDGGHLRILELTTAPYEFVSTELVPALSRAFSFGGPIGRNSEEVPCMRRAVYRRQSASEVLLSEVPSERAKCLGWVIIPGSGKSGFILPATH
jgi:hypothetical protein